MGIDYEAEAAALKAEREEIALTFGIAIDHSKAHTHQEVEGMVRSIGERVVSVMSGGKHRLGILEDTEHVGAVSVKTQRQKTWELLIPSEARSFYKHAWVFMENDNGKLKVGDTKVSKVDLLDRFLESAKYKRSFKGVVFNPSETPVYTEQGRLLNMWSGFDMDPLEGDWSLIQKHLFEVICRGREEEYQWLINWCADIFQNPGTKPMTALVLYGKEKGTGKGLFVDHILGKLLGWHHKQIKDSKSVMGTFNSFATNALVLHWSEATWSGNRGEIGKIRNLITEETMTVEQKYSEAKEERCYQRHIIVTNESHSILNETGERRFMCMNVSPTYAKTNVKENAEYFGPLVAAVRHDPKFKMIRAFMWHLMNEVQVDTDMVNTVIRNEEYEVQRKETLNSIEDFATNLPDILTNGIPSFKQKMEPFLDGSGRVPSLWSTEELKDLYNTYCNFKRFRYVQKLNSTKAFITALVDAIKQELNLDIEGPTKIRMHGTQVRRWVLSEMMKGNVNLDPDDFQ